MAEPGGRKPEDELSEIERDRHAAQSAGDASGQDPGGEFAVIEEEHARWLMDRLRRLRAGEDLAAIEDDYAADEAAPRGTGWATAATPLERLLAAARDIGGARTLAGALDLDLGGMASTLGLRPALERIALADLTGDRRAADDVLARLLPATDAMSEAERLIAHERLFASSPQTPRTLQQLGDRIGVSRERVRQIEARLKRRLARDIKPPLRALAAAVGRRLGPAASEAEFQAWTRSLFDHAPASCANLATAMLRSELGYSCEDGVCLSAEAIAVVERLRSAAGSHADPEGLIDEPELRGELPDEGWTKHWPTLIGRCGFHRIAGQLALRDTQKALVKATLIAIGAPATRDEIAEASGVRAAAVGSQLSAISGVVRADKRRWALAEWVDEEYAGIAAEIIQRIENDGGSTPLNRLLRELPRRFGVSETSVRAYAGAPRFAIEGGFVRLADEASIRLRPLGDVIDGRDERGAPWWAFEVEDRYFEGYSLPGFPPELAVALGCDPGGSASATIVNLPGRRDLSVIWRLTSLAGASLGYLAEPLRRLGVRAGDRVRVVVRGPGAVELRREP